MENIQNLFSNWNKTVRKLEYKIDYNRAIRGDELSWQDGLQPDQPWKVYSLSNKAKTFEKYWIVQFITPHFRMKLTDGPPCTHTYMNFYVILTSISDC